MFVEKNKIQANSYSFSIGSVHMVDKIANIHSFVQLPLNLIQLKDIRIFKIIV